MLNYDLIGGLGDVRFNFENINFFLVMVGLPFAGLMIEELTHEFVIVVGSNSD